MGAEICRHLHVNSVDVVIHCNHSTDEAQALATELNASRKKSAAVVQADLNQSTAPEILRTAVLDHYSRCDFLVNNASSFYPTPVGAIIPENWQDLFNTNAMQPLMLAQALADELKSTRGAIVNLADIYGFRPLKHHTVYSMAKAANLMLTKSLAIEMAPHVRVNGVAPGAALWPEDSSGNEIENPELMAKIPLGRIGGAQSIAEAVVFLALKSPYTTGTILTVDGGRSAS